MRSRQKEQPDHDIGFVWQRLDDESGEVTVSLKHQKIVKVARDGTITLNSGGHRGVSCC